MKTVRIEAGAGYSGDRIDLRRPFSNSVTRSLALDARGKCLGSALLATEF